MTKHGQFSDHGLIASMRMLPKFHQRVWYVRLCPSASRNRYLYSITVSSNEKVKELMFTTYTPSRKPRHHLVGDLTLHGALAILRSTPRIRHSIFRSTLLFPMGSWSEQNVCLYSRLPSKWSTHVKGKAHEHPSWIVHCAGCLGKGGNNQRDGFDGFGLEGLSKSNRCQVYP